MYIEIKPKKIAIEKSDFAQYWMKSLFIKSASKRYQINALIGTYIRLVEASVIEYNLGVSELNEYWKPGSSVKVGNLNRAISHFETCISNIYRATNCFRKLRKDREKDEISVLIFREKSDFYSNQTNDKFRKIRNEIHHLENLVVKGEITEGQSFSLLPDGPEDPHSTEENQTIKKIDRLIIGSKELKFEDIENQLREMLKYVRLIGNYLPNTLAIESN